jgi:DNA modification methylase
MTLQGDSLIVLKDFPDNSIDSVVTDPPYGLSFMNKKWDHSVPSVELWKEVFRILKPGGHLLSFGGTRTYHRMVVNIEDAGFEIRDQIQWLYGSGFPKSHNLNDEFKGWGTALKPANEPIVLARKPLEKGLTVFENVSKWGVGALNIDESRIECERPAQTYSQPDIRGNAYNSEKEKRQIAEVPANLGRWPSNVLLDETAAAMLDKQSEIDASRFFYVAKASKRERGKDNIHPTVKPIKLMQYLIRLITPPGGIVLDPFMGSGSTGIAAKSLDFDFIGIELDPEYIKIANKRIGSRDER